MGPDALFVMGGPYPVRRPGSSAQPGRVPPVTPGTTTVELATGAEALVRVPQCSDAGHPAAMVVLLHGAGGDARGGLGLLEQQADEAGLLLVAPSSFAATWDGVLGRVGPDRDAIQALVDDVLGRHEVDPAAVAVGGFSDGASYALGLGLADGDLFRHVVAFSPGFVAGAARLGRPRLFVSHGTGDPVLPIDRCGRPVARRAADQGYDVTFLEFDGGHTVPDPIRRAAVRWLVEGKI
jgi:phospholipase/carboxylesterase